MFFKIVFILLSDLIKKLIISSEICNLLFLILFFIIFVFVFKSISFISVKRPEPNLDLS